MIVEGREVVLTSLFITQLAAIQEYFNEINPKQGRKLSTNLFNFITDVIPLHPYMFAEYSGKPTPEHSYRRAVYKKNHLIIYKVSDLKITFLTIFHTSRNPSSIDLGEEL
ncbi:type II toxin-antitoxin system RelE/ParE family toxin [Larkinella terrae]|uniref:Type II toxin-antitoxin system RelE/ParE family toxin n=1 Tax=Larkinella terrae TaxID=2025311 RepID=A0A7K0ERM1_9BACT|nr:type II toxin-antitoxin system RelE/ParE family toxin [Larkinella terrae]MRS64186.1 hypothetical protein [Larkinella terrae]